jgi:RND family efflux transporter MFP subunit
LTEINVSVIKSDLTKREYQRQTTLNKTQATPVQKFDQAFAEYQLALQEGERARMNHRLAQLELQRSQAVLQQRVIRSPIDGVVTQRTLGPGEYVSQEASIVTIAAIDPLNVETFLPTRYYRQVKVGDLATVRPNEPVGGERSARVTVVDSVFDAASATFGVRLALANPDGALPGGFRCRVEFTTPEIPEPAAASLKEVDAERPANEPGR